MNEGEDIANWIAARREKAPVVDGDLCADVMERVRRVGAASTLAERIAAVAGNFVPARRPELVYLGGSAFAGVLRVSIILYLVLGVY